MMRTMSSALKRSLASKASLSSRPLTSSMAMYQTPASSPKSWMATMLGWDSRPAAWASRRNRAITVAGSPPCSWSGRMVLRAMTRLICGS